MLRVRGWSSFQSYKDRKPPWIRLHKTLLDDFEFHSMSANARALLPMLWLLASEDKDPVSGLLRDGHEKIAFRLRMKTEDVYMGICECIDKGFLEDLNEDNQQVTDSLQSCHETVTPEAEAEAEAEADTEKKQNNGQQVDRFPDFWTVYPEKKKKKTAREIWKRKHLDMKADDLIADVKARMERDGQWKDGFIPHPTTYLNQERWEDDFTPIKEKQQEQLWKLTDNQLIDKAKGKNIGTQGKSRDQLIAALEAQ